MNTYVVEVDGHEWLLEIIGDECVVADNKQLEDAFMRVLMPTCTDEDVTKFLAPHRSKFSFPASFELRSLIYESNLQFEKDETCLPGYDERITMLAAPLVRAGLRNTENV